MRNAQTWRPGGHFGAVTPQMTTCASLNESCAPKKLIGSGLLECKLRPTTRKIVLIPSEFVEN